MRICCRILNSFNLSVVNCEVLLDDDIDDTTNAGGLFSLSVFTFSTDSILSSGLTSFEDVDDDAEGGLASKTNPIKTITFKVRKARFYKLNRDRDDDCETRNPTMLTVDVTEMLDRISWNVDDDDDDDGDSQGSNDDNPLVAVPETNHRCLILMASREKQTSMPCSSS